jgi:hypothetical protein
MTMLRILLTAAGSAVLLLLVALVPANAQVFVNRGINPWTGRAHRNVTVHNPWTGRTGTFTRAYNPWTGTTVRGGTVHNPWTGRTVAGGAVRNPWTGETYWGVTGNRRW